MLPCPANEFRKLSIYVVWQRVEHGEADGGKRQKRRNVIHWNYTQVISSLEHERKSSMTSGRLAPLEELGSRPRNYGRDHFAGATKFVHGADVHERLPHVY